MTNPTSPKESLELLTTAYAVLREECDRIKDLLVGSQPVDGNPLDEGGQLTRLPQFLVEKQAPINTCLARLMQEMGKLKAEIQDTLDDDKDPDPQKLRQTWGQYRKLKQVILPALSSELLAIIGGIILQKEGLENLQPEGPELKRLSFSDVARRLGVELHARSYLGVPQMLIVGDEFLDNPFPEIIRLRFPGCDIWNLPFTAHEYGYQAARNGKAVGFKSLRDEVEDVLQPKVKSFADTDTPACFLEDIQLLFTEFKNLASPDSREQFIRQHGRKIDILRERQIAHLSRLFGDAFATFFVGPAYLYALLFLRFMDDESLDHASLSLPPFDVRYVFSLEVLKWMNTDRTLLRKLKDNPEPFRLVLKEDASIEPESIPRLWRNTMNSLGKFDSLEAIQHRYEELRQTYGPWIEGVKEALTQYIDAISVTYSNWTLALTLSKELGGQISPAGNHTDWAVVNAAWLARRQARDPRQVETIRKNALKLLDLEARKTASPAGASAGQPRAGDARSAARDTPETAMIEEVLAGDLELKKRFMTMKASQAYRPDPPIQIFLNKYDKTAYNAFLKISGQGHAPAIGEGFDGAN